MCDIKYTVAIQMTMCVLLFHRGYNATSEFLRAFL